MHTVDLTSIRRRRQIPVRFVLVSHNSPVFIELGQLEIYTALFGENRYNADTHCDENPPTQPGLDQATASLACSTLK